MPEFMSEKVEQLHLQGIARREAGMASLACEREILLTIPVEPCLAQAGAGSDHRGIPGGVRCTLVERNKIVWSQYSDAVRMGLQIIEQPNRPEVQCTRQLSSIDVPWKVRCVTTSMSHRAGHSEAGDIDRQVMCRHKRLHDGFQVRMVATRIGFLDDRFQASATLGEES